MSLPTPTGPADVVELTFEDGCFIIVDLAIADRVRGVDADGDLLIPLGEPHSPIRHDDGTEYLIPLTPCCHATGKGSVMAEGVGLPPLLPRRRGQVRRPCLPRRRRHHHLTPPPGSPALCCHRREIAMSTVHTVALQGMTGHLLTLTATAVAGPSGIVLRRARDAGPVGSEVG